MTGLDLRLCVITAHVPELARGHEDILKAAIQGGASMVQFRDKTMTDSEFATTASRLLERTRAAGIPLIVNDRVRIAVAVGADGVHVGWNDGDAAKIKDSLPKDMILGVSARNYSEALVMNRVGADYLGVGPIFPTDSKDDASIPIGLDELEKICRQVQTPVMAIGGINANTLPHAFQAGVAGAAVISAVTHALSMIDAVRELITVNRSPEYVIRNTTSVRCSSLSQ